MAHFVKKIGAQFKYRAGSWPDADNGSLPAENSLQGCLYALRTAGASEMIIYPLTYAGTELSATSGILTNGSATALSIRGPLPTDGENYVPGAVNLSGLLSGTTPVFKTNSATHSGYDLSHLTISEATTTGAYGLYVSAPMTSEKLTIDHCHSAIFFLRGGSTFADLTVKNCTNASYCVYFYNDAAFGDVTFTRPVMKYNAGPVYIHSGSVDTDITINNGLFAGFGGNVFYGTPTNLTINNSILVGNGLAPPGASSGGGRTAFARLGGTWTLNNCLVQDRPQAVETYSNIAFNNCLLPVAGDPLTASPLLRRYGHGGAISVQLDDSPGYAQFRSLVALADTYGYPVGLAVSYWGADTIDWAELAEFVSRGHEVICHQRSAVRLHIMAALTVQKAATTITVAITRADPNDSSTWTGTLQLSGQPAVDLSAPEYDTITKIQTYLSGQGITVTLPTGQASFANDYYTKALCLSSATYDITTAKTLLFDATSLYVVEMSEAKAWLEAQMRAYLPEWSANTFAWSGGLYSAESENYALNVAGFKYARATTFSAVGEAIPSYKVSALALSRMGAENIETQFGPTNDLRRAHLTAYLDALAVNGAVGAIYDHTYDAARWAAIFDAIRYSSAGVQVMTFEQAGDWAVAQADHVTAGIAYKFADGGDYWPDMDDIRTRPGSPCREAGLDVGLTADFLGRAVPHGTAPDIGPSESGYDNFRRRRLVGGQRFGAQAINR